MPRRIVAFVIAAGACGSTSPQTVQLREAVAAASHTASPAVAFRLPARRGPVRLYDLPSLDEVPEAMEPAPAGARPVGFSPDDGLLYATADSQLLALDLRVGHFRTLDSSVTTTAMSPTGTVLIDHPSRELSVTEDRHVAPAGRVGDGITEALWPGPRDRNVVLARTDSGRVVRVVAGPGGHAPALHVPDGPFARTEWGDALAIASPAGKLAIVELLDAAGVITASLPDSAVAVTFSAAAHRVYVATVAPELVVYERFTGDRIQRLRLSARVTALRADRFGRYVFGKAGDTLMAFDAVADTILWLPGGWAEDLPAAGPDGTVLVRRGQDVLAELPGDSVPRDRVRGGAADRWIVAAWNTGRGDREVAQAGGRGTARASSAGQALYVQVSSTSNPQWAEGLASDLRSAGMRASVLSPSRSDEAYRVVIGPYATREEAETIGRKLGMPYWIFTRDSTATQP